MGRFAVSDPIGQFGEGVGIGQSMIRTRQNQQQLDQQRARDIFNQREALDRLGLAHAHLKLSQDTFEENKRRAVEKGNEAERRRQADERIRAVLMGASTQDPYMEQSTMGPDGAVGRRAVAQTLTDRISGEDLGAASPGLVELVMRHNNDAATAAREYNDTWHRWRAAKEKKITKHIRPLVTKAVEFGFDVDPSDMPDDEREKAEAELEQDKAFYAAVLADIGADEKDLATLRRASSPKLLQWHATRIEQAVNDRKAAPLIAKHNRGEQLTGEEWALLNSAGYATDTATLRRPMDPAAQLEFKRQSIEDMDRENKALEARLESAARVAATKGLLRVVDGKYLPEKKAATPDRLTPAEKKAWETYTSLAEQVDAGYGAIAEAWRTLRSGAPAQPAASPQAAPAAPVQPKPSPFTREQKAAATMEATRLFASQGRTPTPQELAAETQRLLDASLQGPPVR